LITARSLTAKTRKQNIKVVIPFCFTAGVVDAIFAVLGSIIGLVFVYLGSGSSNLVSNKLFYWSILNNVILY